MRQRRPVLILPMRILGIRPCSGDVDKERQARLLERAKAAVETVTGICPGVGSRFYRLQYPAFYGDPKRVCGLLQWGCAHTRGGICRGKLPFPLGYRVAFEMIFGGRS